MEYTKQELKQLKGYVISIRILDKGCVVTVGCKDYAFEEIEDAMAELKEYIEDPIGVGKQWEPEHFSEEDELKCRVP